MVVKVVSYRLRGGQLQPRSSNCAGSNIDGFFMQTFGAEKIVTDVYDAKTTLLTSSDFQGQKEQDATETPDGPGYQNYIDTTFAKASYQGRPLRTTDGDLVYSASEEHVAEFINEEEIGSA